MKVFIKHILRNIWEKKFRSATIIITVFLTTMLFMMSINVNDMVSDAYSKHITQAYGEVDYSITMKDMKTGGAFETEDLSFLEVTHNGYVETINYLGKFEKDESHNVKTKIIGASLDQLEQKRLLQFANENKQKDLKEGQIVINNMDAEKYNLKEGDNIEITINEQSYEFEIYQIALPTGFLSNDESMLSMVMSRKQLGELLGAKEQINGLYIDITESESEKLKDINEDFNIDPIYDAESVAEVTASFQLILYLALFIMLIMSGVVLSSMYKFILNDRFPVIGTFRSIGASRRSVSKILLAESCIYGFIGGIFGSLAGYLMLPVFSDMLNLYKEYGTESKLQFQFQYVIASILFALAIVILSTIRSIIAMSKTSLKDSIFNTVHKAYIYKKSTGIIGAILVILGLVLCYINTNDQLVFALVALIAIFIGFLILIPTFTLIICKLIGSIGKPNLPQMGLASKNLTRNKTIKQIILISVISIVLTISVFSALLSLESFLKNSYDVAIFRYIINVSDTNATKYEEIEDIEGIDSTYLNYSRQVRIVKDNTETVIQLKAMDSQDNLGEFMKDAIKYDKETLKTLKENEVILDKYLLERLQLKVGDTLEILAEDKTKEYKIVDTLDSYLYTSARNVAVIPLATYKEQVSEVPDAVFANSTLELEMGKEKIQDWLLDTDSTVLTIDEFIGGQEQSLSSILLVIRYCILIGVGICLLGIINNLSVSYMQRKKEFAILESTSMSKVQILSLIVFETINWLIVSVLCSLALSRVLIIPLSQLLNSVGVPVTVVYPTEFVAILLAIYGGIFIISMIVPIKIVSKSNIIEQLKSE